MKSIFISVLCALFVAGCSTMTPTTYSPSADTNVELKKLEGAKLSVASVSEESEFDAGCRLMGPIEASNNRTVAEFVRDSFNDELKFAGLYSDEETGVQLNAVMENIEFSSMDGLTSGWWAMRVRLSNSDNGEELTAETRYTFKSGFDAITACNQTAQALTPAVQQLIYSAITHPDFGRLVGLTKEANDEVDGDNDASIEEGVSDTQAPVSLDVEDDEQSDAPNALVDQEEEVSPSVAEDVPLVE